MESSTLHSPTQLEQPPLLRIDRRQASTKVGRITKDYHRLAGIPRVTSTDCVQQIQIYDIPHWEVDIRSPSQFQPLDPDLSKVASTIGVVCGNAMTSQTNELATSNPNTPFIPPTNTNPSMTTTTTLPVPPVFPYMQQQVPLGGWPQLSNFYQNLLASISLSPQQKYTILDLNTMANITLRSPSTLVNIAQGANPIPIIRNPIMATNP